MQVEVSLAEMLINAIAGGRIRHVQFKRGTLAATDKETSDDLNAVIGHSIGQARDIAYAEGLRKFDEERGTARLRRAEQRVAELERHLAEAMGHNP